MANLTAYHLKLSVEATATKYFTQLSVASLHEVVTSSCWDRRQRNSLACENKDQVEHKSGSQLPFATLSIWFGQGSGKTYTMQGPRAPCASWGIIPRALRQIFQESRAMTAQGWTWTVEARIFPRAHGSEGMAMDGNLFTSVAIFVQPHTACIHQYTKYVL